jgi:ubiquinone/menaquinone biosynthesis C-methylase UbiE
LPVALPVALAVVACAVAAAALAYWLLAITEGAYLGPRFVTCLYDRGADTYDRIKQFDRTEEIVGLANPVFEQLAATGGARGGRLLDVCSGTARLPLALFDLPDFDGTVVAVDLSRRMLEVAAAKTAPWAERCTLLLHAATPLPYVAAAFDAVTLLEALEFLPDRAWALSELVRVLAPGGPLTVTNRIGIDARLMPGRVDAPADFERRLIDLGLVDVVTVPWMTYYSLVFARKPGTSARRDRRVAWFEGLLCPSCGVAGRWLADGSSAVACDACGHRLTSDERIWEMRPSASPAGGRRHR